MQIHKILQYNFLELIHILIFRILYKSRLLIRKLVVAIKQPRFQAEYGDGNEHVRYESIESYLSEYFRYVNKDRSIVLDQAELIISGRTKVFGHIYPFNPEVDWLKDLETGKFWPRDVYWNDARFIVNGLSDVKLVLEVNKLNDIVVLAHAYYVSKEEHYISFIENYLFKWSQCVLPEKSVANKIVMDLGFRVINLIHVSLLCHDNKYFRERIHPVILGIIKQHVGHLWNNLSSRWYKSGNDNNHNIGEIVGLYVGQMWLKHFGLNVYLNKIDNEIRFLEDVAKKMIAQSGCYMEQSANYTRVVHDFFLIFEIFRHSLDTKRCFGWFDESDYFDKLSRYILDISYHGILPNFGDNDYARVVIPFEDRNDVVAHVKKHCAGNATIGDYSSDGQWVYHSKDENDVFVFTRVGLFAAFVEGAFAHSHNDLLAIELFVKGRPVFIDKGTLYYNSGIDIRKEFTSTESHNTIQIGSREMADYLPIGYCNYPNSSVVISEINSDSCRFQGYVSYNDIKHSREIQYDGSRVIILDSIKKATEGKEMGKSRFLTSEEVVVSISNHVLYCEDKTGVKLCSISFDGITDVVVREIDYAPHYALRKNTQLIEASFDINSDKEIKTTICLI